MRGLTLASIAVGFTWFGAAHAQAQESWTQKLTWLSHAWCAEQSAGEFSEQTWLAPANGTMTGVFRLVKASSLQITEHLNIHGSPQGPVLTIHRFGKDQRPLPKTSGGFESYSLSDVTDHSATFKSTSGYFREMIYRRTDSGMTVTLTPKASAAPPIHVRYVRKRCIPRLGR